MRRNNALAKDIMTSTPPVVVRRIETRMLVAKMLHDYLDIRGISQQEFAGKMGKQPSEVSKWLSGNHNFTIDTLSDIGYYLDTDFLIRRGEMPSFRCIKVLQISKPNTKTGNFGTFLGSFVSVSDYIPNENRVEKCLA